MRFFISTSENIYFNLAAEEFLLKNSVDDICFLWKSQPSVVVGKHQNINAEINAAFIYENKVKIARRISGGGTVFHDKGNLNFTFIVNGKEGHLVDFKKHLEPVIGFLATLNLKAEIGKTNDLRIDDLKISGNAEHVFRKRVLHHGTLLFDSDITKLREAIKVTGDKYCDKAVQSNRSKVVNITSLLKDKYSIDVFTEQLASYLIEKKGAIENPLTSGEIEEINKLAREKFDTLEWIYDYSPKYTFKNDFIFKDEPYIIELNVKSGFIESCRITGKDGEETLEELSGILTNTRHAYPDIYQLVNNTIYKEIVYSLF